MQNDQLLHKYKIKLSVYFALFVMFFLYLIQILFVGIQFISAHFQIQQSLIQKAQGIENILRNKQVYFQEMENDETLEKIILKTLENTIIFENNQKILDFGGFSYPDTLSVWITNDNEKKYYVWEILIQDAMYKIIIFTNHEYSFEIFWKQMGLYFLLLSPFFILFYFIGYKFVGRNFRVIEQNIHALEDFTSQVNHEMKTPLTEIISTLSLAKKTHNYQEAIEVSLLSTLKLNKILESIMGMAHLSDISYRKQKLDIWVLIDEILDEYKNEIWSKKLIFQKNIHPSKKYVKENREQVYLCLKNLISNAIKYSHQSGLIEIFFEKWVFIIQDYGVGIDKWNLKKIFQRYFRESYTSYEWFGLGLALVKKIVDINHWSLEVESQKGEFTKITIKF